MGYADGQGAIAKQEKEKRHASKAIILLNIIRPLQLITAFKCIGANNYTSNFRIILHGFCIPRMLDITRFNHAIKIIGYGENENFNAILKQRMSCTDAKLSRILQNSG